MQAIPQILQFRGIQMWKADMDNSENYEISGPVGVFDSGVGGISVLSELVKLMPDEDFIYFGDIKQQSVKNRTRII